MKEFIIDLFWSKEFIITFILSLVIGYLLGRYDPLNWYKNRKHK